MIDLYDVEYYFVCLKTFNNRWGKKNPQTTISEELTPTKYEVTNTRKYILKKISLLLCDSCFWTASYIYNLYNNEKLKLNNCPMCEGKTKYLPVSTGL